MRFQGQSDASTLPAVVTCALVLVCLAGCSSSPIAAPKPSSALDATDAQQHLLRMRYAGPNGSGSLRLVLVVGKSSAYDLRVSDSFGRSLWRLTVLSDQVLFVDHRQRLSCLTSGSFRLEEPALEPFPARSLSAILLGRLPVEASEVLSSTPMRTEFLDAEGRRWTTTRKSEQLQAWTLWGEEVPVVWWTRHQNGGILSHRGGGQFRWQTSVSEDSSAAVVISDPPADYQEVTCSEAYLPQLREDQPALAGPGSS